jgi:hypothetical protein
VFITRAVSSTVQLAGGAEEKAKPGSEGMMTSNETEVPSDSVTFCVRFLTKGRNSRNEPGQPWKRTSGMAFASLDFSWTKWRSRPSIVVLKCWKLRLEVRFEAKVLLIYIPIDV